MTAIDDWQRFRLNRPSISENLWCESSGHPLPFALLKSRRVGSATILSLFFVGLTFT